MSLYTMKNAQKKSSPVVPNVMIDPTGARSILANKLWDRQRPLRSATVANYSRQMNTGQWQPASVIRYAVLDGKEYLIDGQHRLQAIVDSSTVQEFVCVYSTVASDEELAALYASIDRGLSRTPFDQLHAIGLDDYYGWNQTTTNMIATAVNFIAGGFNESVGRAKLSGLELAEMIETYAVAAEQYVWLYDNTASSVIRAGFRRRATASVALVTLKQSVVVYGGHVNDFWLAIANDSPMKTGDPRKLALHHLMLSRVTGGASRGDRRYTSYYSSRYIANCFNAFVEKRSLKMTRVSETSPIRINGSEFKG